MPPQPVADAFEVFSPSHIAHLPFLLFAVSDCLGHLLPVAVGVVVGGGGGGRGREGI